MSFGISLKFFILCGKLIVCDVIWHLPQVFKSYIGQSKFNSMLHTENDDVSYACHCMICHYIVQLDCQYQVTHHGLPTVQCHW